MIQFKIISDPYKRQVRFETVDSEMGISFPVTGSDNSDLVSDELIHGFFPYNVKRIIDIIYAMKSKQGQAVHIVFEGTGDEYEELRMLCSQDEYKNKIVLEPQKHYLMNAKDILPEISEIFQKMQPLIVESVSKDEQVDYNKRRFEEAVNKQVVPICVIGNYSSGKSTFINALVGKEILPSGDDPVTDCVYKITRSQNAESGEVKIYYRSESLSTHFKMDADSQGCGCTISGAGRCEDDFMMLIQIKMDSLASKPVHIRIHELLALIEEHKKQRKREGLEKDIEPLIEISLPFSKEGVLAQSQCRYVIFDTPGEGSATNVDHSEVLQKQLQSLSNGLIIFITDNKSLDKIEGRDLCEKLMAMECFDDRFTMVVANRADCAKLPREGFQIEDVQGKIGQTVCQTLRSNRIFYVSSIVGLGSKLEQGEEFIDEDYQDVFDKEEESYTNPDAKHPKALYRYNIIPEQMKTRCVIKSEKEPNRALANSGLYWIEQEICRFAEVYSPYNKCTQSKHFLDEIIDETSKRIDKSQDKFEATKRTLSDNLAKEEGQCIEYLETTAQSLCEQFSAQYPSSEMNQIIESSSDIMKKEELAKRQAEILSDVQNKSDYDTHKEEASFFKADDGVSEKADTKEKDSLDEVTSESETEMRTDGIERKELKDVVSNVWSALKSQTQRTVKMAADTIQSTADVLENKRKLRDLEKRIEREVSKLLFDEVKQKFAQQIREFHVALDESSKQYWLNVSEEFRTKMITAVTKSEGITEEKKAELEEIIANYDALEFDDNADMVFVFANLKRYLLKVGDFTIGETEGLNLNKLEVTYNTSMRNKLTEARARLRTSHEGSFNNWER